MSSLGRRTRRCPHPSARCGGCKRISHSGCPNGREGNRRPYDHDPRKSDNNNRSLTRPNPPPPHQVPAEVEGLKANLRSLTLSDNQLKELPLYLGQLAALRTLNVDRNLLSSLAVAGRQSCARRPALRGLATPAWAAPWRQHLLQTCLVPVAHWQRLSPPQPDCPWGSVRSASSRRCRSRALVAGSDKSSSRGVPGSLPHILSISLPFSANRTISRRSRQRSAV